MDDDDILSLRCNKYNKIQKPKMNNAKAFSSIKRLLHDSDDDTDDDDDNNMDKNKIQLFITLQCKEK